MKKPSTCITRNPGYYNVAVLSKFVRPGSVRIASNELETLPNVAFKTPKGRKVVLVLNTKETAQAFNIRAKEKILNTALPAGSVGTYVW